MGKIYESTDGCKFEMVSRWIAIQEMVVTRNHSLWDYSDHDIDCGANKYHPVFYFIFNHRKYALGEFIRLGTPWAVRKPIELIDTRYNNTIVLSAVNTDYGDQLYIEFDEANSYIRLYKEVES